MRRIVAIVVALLAAAAVPAAGDGGDLEIDVVVNARSGVTRLSSSELTEIFNGSRTSWGASSPIVAFNLPAKHPLRVEFDGVVLDMSPDQVGRYWIDQRIRGGARPPRQIDDPTVVARLVAKLPGAIGYAPTGLANHPDVRIVARIRNRKVIDP